MQTKLLLGAALVAAQFAAVSAFAKSKSVRVPFTAIYFTPTDGRVGYRIGTGISVNFDDVPQGNTGGPFSGSCQGHYQVSHVGTLPPGIEADSVGGVRDLFYGTPRQPGRWTIIANVSIGCSAGPDLTRYERQVPITFNVEP